MKKTLIFALTALMICSLAVTAFAADPVTLTTSAGDKMTFSLTMPEKFKAANVVTFIATDWDKDASVDVGDAQYPADSGVHHTYTQSGNKDSKIVYKFTVPAAGKYEFCFDMRIKDAQKRWNNIAVNGGTPILVDMTPGDQLEAIRNADTQGVYMTGFTFELKAGENTLEISNPSAGTPTLHWRNFYVLGSAAAAPATTKAAAATTKAAATAAAATKTATAAKTADASVIALAVVLTSGAAAVVISRKKK